MSDQGFGAALHVEDGRPRLPGGGGGGRSNRAVSRLT